ncbi:hypothetical protein OG389_35315 [Streptomyces sp. NBC_00435]|uniref:hypothetical protein n=1 Tax=Streptomyces sp. NBC_00435 TaxID=2903649 RepID=UPI002E1DE2CE
MAQQGEIRNHSRAAGRILSRTDTGAFQRRIRSTTASIREPTGGKSASSSAWLPVVRETARRDTGLRAGRTRRAWTAVVALARVGRPAHP